MFLRPDEPAIMSTGQAELAICYRRDKAYLLAHHLGLLPGIDPADLAHLHDVLEIGCGPGGWTMQAALTYPEKHITGIDSNPALLAYARRLAAPSRLNNVHLLLVPSLAGPFETCSDASFDLICAQSLSTLLMPSYWVPLLSECWRLLRPGGKICLTDFELGFSNSPAHEEFVTLLLRALSTTGQIVVPTERHLGGLCELEPLISNAGFQAVMLLPHLVNYSYGAASSVEWKMDFLLFCHLCQALIVRTGTTTQAYLEKLLHRLKLEMSLPGFHACMQGLTVTGTK